MGYIFAFLARECGWDYKFIIKNLTLSQIKIYLEFLNEIRFHEIGKSIEGNFYAFAAGQGAIKEDVFQDYLNTFFKKEKQDINESLEKMKSQGLPIEEN